MTYNYCNYLILMSSLETRPPNRERVSWGVPPLRVPYQQRPGTKSSNYLPQSRLGVGNREGKGDTLAANDVVVGAVVTANSYD